MARGAFCGNVFQVELSPGVRHVLGFLDCMLPSFLQKQTGVLGFWDSAGQFLPPCDSQVSPASWEADSITQSEL